MQNNAPLISIGKVVESITDCKLILDNNKNNIHYTRQNLQLWSQNDMDRLFSSAYQQAEEFYRAADKALGDFETEQIKFVVIYRTISENLKMLLGLFYPDYKEALLKYYETIAQVYNKGKSTRYYQVPNIPIPADETYFKFYREVAKLRSEFNESLEHYNNAVENIRRLKMLNNARILGQGFITKIFSDERTVLRKIFNAISVEKLNIDL